MARDPHGDPSLIGVGSGVGAGVEAEAGAGVGSAGAEAGSAGAEAGSGVGSAGHTAMLAPRGPAGFADVTETPLERPGPGGRRHRCHRPSRRCPQPGLHRARQLSLAN